MIDTARLRLQERVIERGDDYWIEDDHGDRVYRVDDRALLIRDAFILGDPDGIELAKVQESQDPHRDAVAVERQGRTIATVRKHRSGLRHRFAIDLDDGMSLDVHGHPADHNYEIRRGGDIVATVSTDWFTEPHTYGIETGDAEDKPMVVALTVALDELSRR